jgi:hypothetical protein
VVSDTRRRTVGTARPLLPGTPPWPLSRLSATPSKSAASSRQSHATYVDRILRERSSGWLFQCAMQQSLYAEFSRQVALSGLGSASDHGRRYLPPWTSLVGASSFEIDRTANAVNINFQAIEGLDPFRRLELNLQLAFGSRYVQINHSRCWNVILCS